MPRLRSFAGLPILSLVACMGLGCDDGSQAAAAKDQKTLQAAGAEWSALSGCVVGPELAEGELASVRMRASELTLVAQGTSSDWPKSCNQLADTLATTLGTLASKPAVERHKELLALARDFADTSPAMMVATDTPLVDRLFAAAAAAGLSASAKEPSAGADASSAASAGAAKDAGSGDAGAPTAASEGAAPNPSQPFPAEQLAALGESKGFIERVERAPSETIRFMLGDADAGAFYCALGSSESASLDHASCTKLEGEVAVAATPLSADEPDAKYYWDAEPAPAVHQVGGEATPLAVGQNAYVFSNGTIGDIVPRRLKPQMLRLLARGKVERAPLNPPPGGQFLGHVGASVIWRGPKRGSSGKRPFVVQNLQAGRAALSGRFERGEIPTHSKHLAACASGELAHVLLVSDPPKAEDGKREVAVATRNGDKWGKPRWAEIDFGSKIPNWSERGWRSFTCQQEVATFTWIRSDRRVGQLRCGADACTPALSEPLPEGGAKEKIRVSNLSDKALVVRTMQGVGPISGLTELVAMRLAPVSELAATPERVLLGDDKHMGLPDLHKSLGLIGSGAAAVVLVHSGPKIFGLRIDGAGKVGKLALDGGGT
jgi:hypothetical protein